MKNYFNRFYIHVRRNFWHALFYLFCRCTLALGFIVAGYVKIIGERFASGLSIKHPMGAYLEALHHTSFYYPFIGIIQIAAGILLLIPRTVVLGGLLYFPIILNIWVLSWAVRFEGSLFTSTLMVLANLYILLYNYERLKFILPIQSKALNYNAPLQASEISETSTLAPDQPLRFTPGIAAFKNPAISKKFPFLFAGGVLLTAFLTLVSTNRIYEIMPRNSYNDCVTRLPEALEENAASFDFCNCIHNQGKPLEACIAEFDKTKTNGNAPVSNNKLP